MTSSGPGERTVGRGVRAGRAGRIVGIDYARFLALAGMMATHLWTWQPDGGTPALSAVLQGKAAALFAVLAGVGIALSTRRAIAEGRADAARWAVFGRGLALLVIGLTLGLFPGSILVILAYYALTFWAMIPFLRVPSRVLVPIAIGWALVWPPLLQLWRSDLVVPFEVGSASWLDFEDPLRLVRGLLVTGVYPVGTWLVYAMVGLVVGRAVLAVVDEPARLRALGVRLAAIGAGLAVVAISLSWLIATVFGGFEQLLDASPELGEAGVTEQFFAEQYGGPTTGSLWWLASPAPHTGTTFDLAITCGTSLLALGLCLALGALLGPRMRLALAPLGAAGGAPLTVYTAHVLAAGLVDALASLEPWDAGVPWQVSSAGLWLLHVAGALLIGLVLALLGRRGPLEALVGWVARRFARLGARRLDG
ncbi:heparan-alpha-glucosaminide N-acetyltransferase domain-containing protein [Agromyces mediolanus]|uniref:hypothetical protein n=1 Tax=Agromyces mediolanus TaxID=41986 RepID=UPI003837A8A9